MVPLKLLFLMANPRGTAALRLNEEGREVRDRLREGLSWLMPGPLMFVYE